MSIDHAGTATAPRTPAGRNTWPRDFALGIRLAVGGGRTSWARLILGTIGTGLAVAVLLLAASVGHIMTDQSARTSAGQPNDTVISGVNPTQLLHDDMSFQGTPITGAYLHGTGANSPIPPGLTSLPGPNQIAMSPALIDLINTNPALRGRFPQQTVATISEAGLTGPADLIFYAGTGPIPAITPGLSSTENVYAFGATTPLAPTDPTLLLVAVIGAVALLIPLFIFVSVSSRIAGAQRDRRLAALRLVGAGNWQVRRIAAAESLVSAATGLVLGALAFLGLRQLAPQVDVLGWSAFTNDVIPSPLLVALIVLCVPALTVATVLFAMRRTIIEPLGVLRDGKPIRRRLWWRLVPIALGIGLLIAAKPIGDPSSTVGITIIASGASLLLLGVPAILPWLLERVVGRVQGGAPSWQLAIRRLQLDSGTPARVVAGVAVVLASSIALQLMLLSTASQYSVPNSAQSNNNDWVSVYTTPSAADQVAAELTKVPAAKQVGIVETVSAINHDISIASCQTIQRSLDVPNCIDGDGFLVHSGGAAAPIKPGDVLNLIAAHDLGKNPKSLGTYTVPGNLTPATQHNTSGPYFGDIALTPGAAATLNLPADRETAAWVLVDPNQPDATDQIADGVGNLNWQVFVSLSNSDEVTANQKTFATIRTLLDGGSLFTLLLAGVSMLVLALEQVRERRRPLAVLAAAGVPRSVLARSLLWQTAVPVVLAVVVAICGGIGLSALVI
ncbi:MAG TPA: FtsX-like permease family protein, partial [Pseudonocardiaceae bacterium]